MSRYLAARFDDDEIHQVLLHEVAHALAGHDAAHGAAWKRVARDLGYVGGTTHHGETAVELAPWVGRMPRRARDVSAPAAVAGDVVRAVLAVVRRALSVRLDATRDHDRHAARRADVPLSATAVPPVRRARMQRGRGPMAVGAASGVGMAVVDAPMAALSRG